MATAMSSCPLLLSALIFYKEEKCPFYVFAGILRNTDYSVSRNAHVCIGVCPQHRCSATSESSVVQSVLDSWYVALHGALFREFGLWFLGSGWDQYSCPNQHSTWDLTGVLNGCIYCCFFVETSYGKLIVSIKLISAGIRSIKSLWVRCIAQYMASG